MSRKRTSTAPPKLRAKLDTAEEINLELKRTYRLFINKQITHADMTRRKELLVALRAGLPDPVERPTFSNSPTVINVHSVADGNMFAPGNVVLLPCEQCAQAWQAYRSGDAAWQAYLLEVKPVLTLEAFENLSHVALPAPGADNVVNLHDRPRMQSEPPLQIEQLSEPDQLAALEDMTIEQLLEQARQRGLGGMTFKQLTEQARQGGLD